MTFVDEYTGNDAFSGNLGVGRPRPSYTAIGHAKKPA